MNTLEFLEKMAASTHYDASLKDILNKQAAEIKSAYHKNNPDLLKKYLGESEYVATPSDVTHV